MYIGTTFRLHKKCYLESWFQQLNNDNNNDHENDHRDDDDMIIEVQNIDILAVLPDISQKIQSPSELTQVYIYIYIYIHIGVCHCPFC
jgi:hypothetical protein